MFDKSIKKSKFQIVGSSRSRIEGKEARGATQGTAHHGNALSACRGTEAIDLQLLHAGINLCLTNPPIIRQGRQG